ncbi:hypothetical protein DL546_005252 [Coniochaeta pulveracea]|uniref:ATP synthase F(0) complex subunit e, mitochondrial n=1 Tax=Coniochaeta pulveracea TaxID=177199 RepID=A0A420Y7P5_9PEZI|nr:hypothetical protein DL546_005252 [Coniochaeta pulveracea]
MSSSSAVNVLRYSALGAGIFYGFYHQRKINQTIHAKHAEQEYKHKQELIEKARAEFAKSKSPVKTESKGDSALNQDPMDPKFDVESYLTALFAKEGL